MFNVSAESLGEAGKYFYSGSGVCGEVKVGQCAERGRRKLCFSVP